MTNGEADAGQFLTLELALPSGKQLQYILDARTTESFVLGRTSTVLVDDPQVSRAHAMVCYEKESGWKLKDLGSTNGTYLNDNRVTAIADIAAGDVIKLGKTTVTVARLPTDAQGVPRTLSAHTWDASSDQVFVRDLVIEINEEEKEREVEEIVESPEFEELRTKALRFREAHWK
jgi:pSer/pThr/pTyr-binding forkhead associated (FHA) protein